ncbi:hypothetical protein K9B32_00020 [Rhizobium sp. 3T7]|uniref:hypothetical protein n=1 Tax=Rhizobium sp. 3T7 TaxID=2874922 RepID=UPI001CCC582B|nr:hypothetical protein [Rhizobium sp. 3T7]MBZ9788529.1 hypothetical protein [Rhizobium sp. 3T7]
MESLFVFCELPNVTAFYGNRRLGCGSVMDFLHGLYADAKDDDRRRGILDMNGGVGSAAGFSENEIRAAPFRVRLA